MKIINNVIAVIVVSVTLISCDSEKEGRDILTKKPDIAATQDEYDAINRRDKAVILCMFASQNLLNSSAEKEAFIKQLNNNFKGASPETMSMIHRDFQQIINDKTPTYGNATAGYVYAGLLSCNEIKKGSDSRSN